MLRKFSKTRENYGGKFLGPTGSLRSVPEANLSSKDVRKITDARNDKSPTNVTRNAERAQELVSNSSNFYDMNDKVNSAQEIMDASEVDALMYRKHANPRMDAIALTAEERAKKVENDLYAGVPANKDLQKASVAANIARALAYWSDSQRLTGKGVYVIPKTEIQNQSQKLRLKGGKKKSPKSPRAKRSPLKPRAKKVLEEIKDIPIAGEWSPKQEKAETDAKTLVKKAKKSPKKVKTQAKKVVKNVEKIFPKRGSRSPVKAKAVKSAKELVNMV